MHIELNNNTKLCEIQEVFSNHYPYLKIEFYKKPHKKYEASEDAYLIRPQRKIGDVKRPHASGVLEMIPLSKVADIEKELQKRFGLPAQIFRKEKNGWEQTRVMDDFTLKELNEFGRNSSDEFIVSDYDEGFEEVS